MNVYNFSFKFCSSILVNLLNCCVKTKCVLFLLKKKYMLNVFHWQMVIGDLVVLLTISPCMSGIFSHVTMRELLINQLIN